MSVGSDKQKRYREGIKTALDKLSKDIQRNWALRDVVFGKTYYFKDFEDLKKFVNS